MHKPVRSICSTFFAATAMLLLVLVDVVWCQPSTSSSVESKSLDQPAMAKELERIARICDSLKLAEQATKTRGWLPTARADQQLLFLADADRPGPTSNDSPVGRWRESFNKARQAHAEFWFQQAKQLASQGDEHASFLALWRTLREDPRHAEAQRILGREAASLVVPIRLRRATVAQDNLAWPAGTYSIIELPHFQLVTRADKNQSEKIARQVEMFYALWSQVFFPLWSAPGSIQNRFSANTREGSGEVPIRKIQVCLLKNRQEYLNLLGAKEENIGVSVGYYNAELKCSFFYPDPNLQATLFHELTHQLLAEATRIDAQAQAGTESSIWMLEGIALYMESLWPGPDYWTVGGWESPRLQIARYRAIRDGFWVPWEQLNSAGRETWKKDPQVARLYTHAAGITHYFMDSQPETASSQQTSTTSAGGQPTTGHPINKREVFLQALVSVYQGDPQLSKIQQTLDSEMAQENYTAAMRINDENVHELNPIRQLEEIVLTGSTLSAAAWKSLSSQRKLKWVDVAFSNVRVDQLEWLSELDNLERLSLEGTRVDGSALPSIAKLESLRELDLSGCPISDQSLEALKGHSRLNTLWLTKTPISDAALPPIAAIPNLTFVDVQQTGISSRTWQQFLKSHPKISRQ